MLFQSHEDLRNGNLDGDLARAVGYLAGFELVESKGSMFTDALRPAEQAKIDCGKEHFKALGTDVKFTVANTYERFSQELTS